MTNAHNKVNLGEMKAKAKGGKFARIRPLLSSADRLYRKNILSRLFWGRTTYHRRFIQISLISITAFVAITGFSNRFLITRTKQNVFASDHSTVGNVDLLEQGGSVQSILLAPTTSNFEIYKYKVKKGDTYKSISSKYNVTVDRIKLSNLDINSYYADKPKVGGTLRIPEINGILIKAKKGEKLSNIKSRLTKGNEIDIIEINNLVPPNYELEAGSYILVPDGLINPPPPPTPKVIYSAPPAPGPAPQPGAAVFAGVQFVDPLSHPSCAGYGYSRGFSSWHNGVDLPRRGGCSIRAVAAGTVEFAGWSSGGEGFYVRINHGNGVKSLYFHGDGRIWVSVGQSVSAGTEIMHMGSTGYSTGTHLHLSLKYNGTFFNPAPYIPYRRP